MGLVALALYGWLGVGILVVAYVSIPLLGRLLRRLDPEKDRQERD